MWDLGNRGAVVLISATCGCVLVYNAWGTILALALTLLFVVYACYSLLVNDSLLSPQAYHIFGYLREAVHELGAASSVVYGHGAGYVGKLWRGASNYYRERFRFRMDRRRAVNYRLSSDTYETEAVTGAAPERRTSSSSSSSSSSPLIKFNLIDQLSPISPVPYRSRTNDTLAMDSRYHTGDHTSQQLIFGKHTSTPVFARDEDFRNGDVGPVSQSHGMKKFSKKIPPMSTQDHTLNRGENVTQFSPEGSPWGMSISPKMRPRPAGVKTVQTVAGPLLASTRYNIDPKVYTDVSSPGFTTRLTKYATEAKSKLTLQSQYLAGQFPKVNLYANPIPLLNKKSTKVRMPVTVRVAPPDMVQYSPPERQKLLSNICHMENNSPTSVVQVLREISLKRHASTEDVSFDIPKKQKTDFFIEERETILEENNKQKRSRDDSSKSDEDFSPQSKSVRPAKRTKTRSCFDILNSLSSSAHVATGVKRKAVDISRSETPNFEKHFKSLESAQPSNSIPALQPQNLDIDHGIPKLKEIYLRNFDNSKKSEEFPLIKGILKSNKESKSNLNEVAPVIDKIVKSVPDVNTKSVASTKSVTLMEKLFMRAEPEQNEQLKVLMDEPGNIKTNFAKDDVEEIKREDIRNMRQTSMKARLQSMFDAISGKAENKINPDVVIQADDMNVVTPPVTCSVSCATLNSTTTTTNVNSTPLSTAVIVPSSFSLSRPDTKADTKSATVFSSTNATPPAQLKASATSTIETKVASTVKTVGAIEQTKDVSIAPAVASTNSLQTVVSSTPSTTPIFTFGKSATGSPAATSSISSPSFSVGISSSNSSFTPVVTTKSISSTSTNFLTAVKPPSSSAFVPINPNATTDVKVTKETSKVVTTSTTISSSITANIQTSPIFTFSTNKSSSSPTTPVQTSISSLSSPSITTGTTLLPIGTTGATTIAGFNSITSFNRTTTSSGTPSIVAATSTVAPLFAFGSNSTASQLPKSGSFTFGQSGNSVQSKTNAFESPSSAQAIPLPQVTSKSFNFMSNTPVTTVASISFTANATSTTTSAFGLSSPPTFSLSASTVPSTSATSISKPLFVFGASSPSATSPTTIPPAKTASNATGFGPLNNNAVPTFKAATTTAISQFGAPTTTVSQFGATTTSIFATTSNITTNTNIFGTANSSQSLFGSTASTTPGTSNVFNSPTTTASSIFASTTTTPSIFAPTTNVASSSNSTTSPSLFSTVNANLIPTTTAPSVFGSGAPIFGQVKPSASFGATGNMFGNTTAPLFNSTTQSGTTAPTFGVTGNVSTATITPSFDTTHNTTSAFGAPNVRTATNTQTTSAFGGTTGMFGSTDSNASSVPIFRANATSAPGAFGTSSSTSTFGTQNPASLNFGVASGGTSFGDNKSPFGTTPTTTTSFNTPVSSVAGFGAGNANNASNNTNSMFVFGSNQKDGQQSTSTFSFGSNFNAGNNNSTAVSSAPFQFGSTSFKPATTGFNFSASSATPTLNFGTSAAPTFNPSTPGMFSIGSGSTAPRSRTIRTRKPR